ncbi:MAG: SRPBCC family protein, partial [Acidimicrobiia bacterium]
MAEQANERISVAASPERCFDVVIDFERYPEWARDVKQATILGRDDDGRGSQVEYRAAGLGKSFHYTLQYDYSEAPGSLSWKLVE